MAYKYNISYEPEADVIAFWTSQKAKIEDAEMVGDVVVHWDKKGNPIMVEFLKASKLIPKIVEALAKREVSIIS